MRREVGAAVCLVLALFSAFGYFDIDALFINFLCGLLKGVLGFGYWIVPPVLLLAFYILTFHRGRPVRLRLVCTLLLPLVFGILLHLFLAPPYEWGKELVMQLWESGRGMKSGGVAGGVVAMACDQAFSKAGTAIILLVGAFFMVLAACNRSVMDIVDYFRNRPRLEYEPEEEPERRRTAKRPAPHRTPAPDPREERRRRQAVDIPLEDGPLVTEQAERPDPEPPRKTGFFNRQSTVKTPDEVLTSQHRPEPVPEEEPELEPEPELEEEPVFQPEDEPVLAEPELPIRPAPEPPVRPAPAPMPEIIREERIPPASHSSKNAPNDQTLQELDMEIQQAMEQDTPPYQYPPLSLLREGEGGIGGQALGELNTNKVRLADTIHSFGIDAEIVDVVQGPSVTRYELRLGPGVRLNKLTNLADNIAMALGAGKVRIAPILNKILVVGIEVPNKVVTPVNIHSVIGSKAFIESASKVSFAVGKDIGGSCIVGNIDKMPHLLIAGTTGSGKSVCTNSLIISLLYKATPEEVRLIMVDPKMVELAGYNGIPHLLIPVVTDPKKAAGALQWAVNEMLKRYNAMKDAGAKNISSYNAKAARTPGMEKLPRIVIILDELADLMMVAAKEVEDSICRIAQMGRAAGMHLVIATQSPRADVITGMIKANVPSKIAFKVASGIESRIVLDTMGAEQLVGMGDMLYAPNGSSEPTRVQGCFISEEEVSNVVEFIKKSGKTQYDEAVIHEIDRHAAEKDKGPKGAGAAAPEGADSTEDELLPAAIEVVVETGQASVSMLQRRLKLGYARAARLVDQMEDKGIVGPFEGSKPRQLLITKEQWLEMQYKQGITVPNAMPQLPSESSPMSSSEEEESDEEETL